MRLLPLLLVCFAISCKPLENSQQEPSVSIREYQPNPDEVVLYLKLIDSQKNGDIWENQAEVIRQLKAGFGYKERLSPGATISMTSVAQVSKGEFYCAAEYQISPGSSGTYTMKVLLKK